MVVILASSAINYTLFLFGRSKPALPTCNTQYFVGFWKFSKKFNDQIYIRPTTSSLTVGWAAMAIGNTVLRSILLNFRVCSSLIEGFYSLFLSSVVVDL